MGGGGGSRGNATTSRTRVTGGHGATRGDGGMRGGDAGIGGGGICRGDATTSMNRGARMALREAMAQREERPCNRDERGWSGRKTQQPTMGVRGDGWQS